MLCQFSESLQKYHKNNGIGVLWLELIEGGFVTYLSECDKYVLQLVCVGFAYTAIYREMCVPVSRNVPKLVGDPLKLIFYRTMDSYNGTYVNIT